MNTLKYVPLQFWFTKREYVYIPPEALTDNNINRHIQFQINTRVADKKNKNFG